MPITTPRKLTQVSLGYGDVGVSTVVLDRGVAVVLEGLSGPAPIGEVAEPQPEARTLGQLLSAVREPAVIVHACDTGGLEVLIAKLEQARSELASGGTRRA